MRVSTRKVWLMIVIAFLTVAGSPRIQKAHADGSDDPTQLPLVNLGDLEWRGAFRLPPSSTLGTDLYEFERFNYGGTAPAYNPINNSLFIEGHPYGAKVAEVGIPDIVDSANLNDLNTADMLQNFADPAQGVTNMPEGTRMGGLMPYQRKDGEWELIGNYYVYYDNNWTQQSHFVTSMELSNPTAKELYTLGDLGAGFVAGYMALIPPEWQALLGGRLLTGQCCLAIISRTSLGPAAFVFNPEDLGGLDPAPTIPLVYYPIDHPTLGEWGGWSPYYGMATSITGMVFPRGTRTLLFFGTHGETACYGYGTDDEKLAGTTDENGVEYCYDPENSSKGTHGYPYHPYVWAYDVNDLLQVKSGEKEPWEVTPYAVGKLDLPYENHIGGAAYDPETGNVYLTLPYGDWEGSAEVGEPVPLVAVLHVKDGAAVTKVGVRPAAN